MSYLPLEIKKDFNLIEDHLGYQIEKLKME